MFSLAEFLRSPIGKSGNTGTRILLCIALAAIVLAVYMQAGNHPFLNFDDDTYVTNNRHVAGGITGSNIIWAFTSVDGANWHPVTWLSHMADVQFYGMNPRGHHLTNVAIHTLSTLLLFLLLVRLTGTTWQSIFVAALFALHPLHVESVAWVAERKDLLCAFFWFLTLLFYAGYVTQRKRLTYILTLLAFVLGLMSKPMLVTLPVVMLLLDFWPLNRFCNVGEPCKPFDKFLALTKEKLPFFLCSLFSGIITIYAQNKGGAVAALTALPLRMRSENALISYVTYIGKTVWPHDLAIYYPMPASIPLWKGVCSLAILLLVSAAVIRGGRRSPYLVAGWFWFLITLLPVIGLIQVGGQSMADRYSYIPVIGLFIMAAWGGTDLAKAFNIRQLLLPASVAVISVSAALTWHQLGYWQDNVSLYRHALRVTTGNAIINYNLGSILQARGDLDAAILEYGQSLRIAPNNKNTHNNLGLVLAAKGDLDAAIREYQAALRIDPDDPDLHNNLGAAFAGKGLRSAAISEYRSALRAAPDDPEVHYNLGIVLQSTGDLEAAIEEYREAFRLDPANFKALHNLEIAVQIKAGTGK